MTSRQNWWRHNSAKTVGIGQNFFLELFGIKINNCVYFYANRLSRSVFSKNIEYDVIVKKWRHKSVKSVGIGLFFSGKFLSA